MAPTITQLPYNWSVDRAGHTIEAIIGHNTVGYDSRLYLSRGGELPDGSDRMVSIHALIQKPGDIIYRYVPDERGANHAGFGTMPKGFTKVNPNLTTIGFELENASNGEGRIDPYPNSQLLAMGWFINETRRRHGPIPILRHADIDPRRRKDTVGLTIAQMEAWAVNAARAQPPAPPAPPPLPGGVDPRFQSAWSLSGGIWQKNKLTPGLALGPAYQQGGLWYQRFERGMGRLLADGSVEWLLLRETATMPPVV
jgi:N-acetylmuramoyl-L-alanine amidase